MSNQIVISSGAKVRSLEGVLTGTAGIVNALGINVANGIPQLDSNAKILVSQLPNSVMEYKGTWNAATNTPTLVNGTGNQGDVYLCNVAGTVNFGAGPISFNVGDQVIYSGTIWQRASGATGTVTSVAITETGDALTITGSPITTSGTINIGFAGTTGQYVNGAGGLTTFPSLTGFVPYTGATANVDLGSYDLTTDIVNLNQLKAVGSGGLNIYSNSGTHIALMGGGGGAGTTFYGGIIGTSASFASSGGSDTFAINHSSGSGISLNITKGGNGEGLYINKTSGSGNAATIIGTLNATTLVKSGGTSSQYLMADGSVSTGPDLTGYVPYTGATTNVNLGNYTLTTGNVWVTNSASNAQVNIQQTLTGNIINAGYTSIWTTGNNFYIAAGASSGGNSKSMYFDLSGLTNNTTRTFTLPDANGTLALTSNLGSYLPLTGGTLTGGLYINPTNTGVTGLDVASNNTSFRSDNLEGSKRQLLITMGSGTLISLTGKGYEAARVTDIAFYTSTSGGVNSTPSIYMTGGGNVGIGGSPSGSYKFEVTGTGYISGILTGGARIQAQGSNGAGSAQGGFLINYNANASSRSWLINNDQEAFGDFAIRTSTTQTGSTYTTRLYINPSGNVGIGTSSPSARLDVRVPVESPATGAVALIAGTSNGANDIFRWYDGTTQLGVIKNNGWVGIGTTNPSQILEVFGPRVKFGDTGGFELNFNATYCAFQIASAEKMRITSGGALQLASSAYFLCGTTGYRFNSSTDAFNNFVALDNGNATLRGTLTQNASDERLKNNIQLIPDALNKINSLRGVTFEWNQEIYETSRTTDIGVIAQDIQSVLPDAVALAPFDTNFDDYTSKSGENYLTVYYEKIIPLLIEGIKELSAKVSALENKA
jgi:hypothetical protein